MPRSRMLTAPPPVPLSQPIAGTQHTHELPATGFATRRHCHTKARHWTPGWRWWASAPAVHSIRAGRQAKHDRHVARQVRHGPPCVLDEAMRGNCGLDVCQREGRRRCQALPGLHAAPAALRPRSARAWPSRTAVRTFTRFPSHRMVQAPPEAWHLHAWYYTPGLASCRPMPGPRAPRPTVRTGNGRPDWRPSPNRRVNTHLVDHGQFPLDQRRCRWCHWRRYVRHTHGVAAAPALHGWPHERGAAGRRLPSHDPGPAAGHCRSHCGCKRSDFSRMRQPHAC